MKIIKEGFSNSRVYSNPKPETIRPNLKLDKKIKQSQCNCVDEIEQCIYCQEKKYGV